MYVGQFAVICHKLLSTAAFARMHACNQTYRQIEKQREREKGREKRETFFMFPQREAFY